MPSLLSDAQLTQIRERLEKRYFTANRSEVEALLALVDQLRQERDEAQSALLGSLKDTRLLERTEAAEEACPRLRRALEALANTYGPEPCWCDLAIGNPMVREHSPQCKQARAALSVRDDGPQTAEKTEETDKAL